MGPLKITATIFLAQARLGLAKPNVFQSFAARRHLSSSTNELPIAWQQAAKDFDPKQVAFYHNEMLIKVDENDAMIGSISKGESHSIDTVRKGIYHRAFSLLVFDEQDRFLLTQRAACKITFPNYYTNACCSHPLFEPLEIEQDDDAIGVKRATIRRSNFELGIDIGQIQPDDLKFVNRLAYRAISDGGLWGEAEIDYIFILQKNVTLNPNPEEVQSFRYVTKEEMKDILENQQKYNIKITPWVKLLAKSFLFSYWDNLHRIDKIAQPKTIVYHRDLLQTC
jgi:isopentenyl-diphosphate delta-isomerase